MLEREEVMADSDEARASRRETLAIYLCQMVALSTLDRVKLAEVQRRIRKSSLDTLQSIVDSGVVLQLVTNRPRLNERTRAARFGSLVDPEYPVSPVVMQIDLAAKAIAEDRRRA